MDCVVLITSFVHFSRDDSYISEMAARQRRRFEKWTARELWDDRTVVKRFESHLPWIERFPSHRFNDIAAFVETWYDGGTRLKSDWFGAYSRHSEAAAGGWLSTTYRAPRRDLMDKAFKHVGRCAETALSGGNDNPRFVAALIATAQRLDVWAKSMSWVIEVDYRKIECTDWVRYLGLTNDAGRPGQGVRTVRALGSEPVG